MAQCMPGLNPPRTFNPKVSISTFSTPSIFSFRTKNSKFKNFSTSVSAMANWKQQQDQQPLSLDALINGARREEFLGPIKKTLPNCLSETNLHLTVPGLKSKTRGKVNTNKIHNFQL